MAHADASSTSQRAGPLAGAQREAGPLPDWPGPSFSRVLAAEWTKLTGLRSMLWIALGTVSAALLLAYALGLFVRPGDGRSGVSLVVSGHPLAQLGPLVLGVLVGAGEYSNGTSTTTFTAVPRRLTVLAAQALETAVVACVTALATLGASFLATHGQRAAMGLAVDPSDGSTAAVLMGFIAYLTCIALLGLGLGALLRHPAAALTTGAMLIVVVDYVLATNAGPTTDAVRALLPGVGAQLIMTDGQLALQGGGLGPHLGRWGPGLVLGVWVVGLLAAAAYRLVRRDVT